MYDEYAGSFITAQCPNCHEPVRFPMDIRDGHGFATCEPCDLHLGYTVQRGVFL